MHVLNDSQVNLCGIYASRGTDVSNPDGGDAHERVPQRGGRPHRAPYVFVCLICLVMLYVHTIINSHDCSESAQEKCYSKKVSLVDQSDRRRRVDAVTGTLHDACIQSTRRVTDLGCEWTG